MSTTYMATRAIFPALFMLAASLPAGAQESADSDSIMDEIVVTAARFETRLAETPRAISSVDRDAIQAATQQLGIDESLVRVPGLYMQNRYNFAQDLRVSLRGFGARSSFGIRGIRIFVDDIPETLPDGQAQVDSIDIGSAERIEVLRGPSSSLYGNAAGGVINVFSERAVDPYVEARIAEGNYGYAHRQVKAGGQFGSVDYLMNLSSKQIDGYRDHSRADGDSFNGRLGWQVTEKGKFNVMFNHTDQPIAQDPGGINAAQAEADPRSARDANVLFDASENLSQQRLGLTYTHEGEGTLLLRNYYVWRDFTNRLPFTSGGAVDLERFFYGAGVQYTRNFMAEDRLRLSAGIDVDRQDDDRLRFDNNQGVEGDLVFDQNEQVSSDGVYLQAQYRLSDLWQLNGGIRQDRIEFDVTDRFLADGDDSGQRTFRETSFSAGVARKSDSGTVFANVSTSFETPTTSELANPDGSGGFNQELQPQTALNIELGMRRASGSWGYELVAFHIDIEDELVPFENPAAPGRTFFENAGESSRLGIEASVNWQNDSGLSALFSYTWSDFAFDTFVTDDGDDFSGNTLPGLPEHFAYVNLEYTREDGFFGLVEASYSGSLYANNANTVKVDSYVVSNMRFGYRFRGERWLIEPFAGINNLLDESYNSNIRINAFGARYFEPAPEPNYYAGIVVRFD